MSLIGKGLLPLFLKTSDSKLPDRFSRAVRSRIMSSIRGKNTRPEKLVCSILRSNKIRFKKHVRSLPGVPDIVILDAKIAIFVDGDFWHGWRFPTWSHKFTPYWREKIVGNRRRDSRNFALLRRRGWKVIRIWEHQLKRSPLTCLSKLTNNNRGH